MRKLLFKPSTMNTRLLGIFGVLLALACWGGLMALRILFFQMPWSLGAILLELSIVLVGAVIFWQWIIATLERQAAEVRRRTKHLEALHAASMTLTTEHDLTEVLQKVVDLSRSLLNAKYGALGILDEDGEAIDQLITSGLSPNARTHMGHFPYGHGLLGVPIHEHRSVRVSNIADDERARGFPPHHPAMHTFLGVPIMSKGRMFGNLYLADKLPDADANIDEPGKLIGGALSFSQQDQDLLEMFANQAAIVIENAQLYRQNQQIAIFHERERFGMDLHDGVIQSIYAIGLLLDDARHRFRKEPETAQQGLDNAIAGLNRVISDIRSYIHDLRTHQFQHRNFEQDLEELVRDLQTYSILNVHLDVEPGTMARINQRLAKDLLQIAREALTNVRKHAHATQVKLQMARTSEGIRLTIVDNGVGISGVGIGGVGIGEVSSGRPQEAPIPASTEHRAAGHDTGHDLENLPNNGHPTAAPSTAGHGLRNMHERAERLNGTLTVVPAPEGGTKVEITIPV